MSKWQQRVRTLMVNYLALPSDVILELPRITIIGQIHVYIENHLGLVTYSDTELKLKMKQGFVQITGTSFVIKMMLPQEILLEGSIKDVRFLPANKQ
ncbi:sporulation protein YqfC [Oceanobacillus chungangensis]|uniref:Sporulation protein YqfC n=1 Tax=Oceanobacillus chungangensis TaxID=1229152 RepID=A0A3D8PZZ4_9BACI|nr:sporulation protein YqfC [Oceanobacillus chungangensis]RDW21766.1 sporulation protein YqfC [Oceanobacillus chungangensis]